MRTMHLFKKVMETPLLTEREKIHTWMILADMMFDNMPNGEVLFTKLCEVKKDKITALETETLHELVKQHIRNLQIIEMPTSTFQIVKFGQEIGDMLLEMMELEARHADDPEEPDDKHIQEMLAAFFLDEGEEK